eukprot:1265015-Prymnesium_polylepis.2
MVQRSSLDREGPRGHDQVARGRSQPRGACWWLVRATRHDEKARGGAQPAQEGHVVDLAHTRRPEIGQSQQAARKAR